MISSQPHRPMLTLQEPLVGPGFHIGASKIVGAVAVARHNMIQYFCHFGHIPKFPDAPQSPRPTSLLEDAPHVGHAGERFGIFIAILLTASVLDVKPNAKRVVGRQ